MLRFVPKQYLLVARVQGFLAKIWPNLCKEDYGGTVIYRPECIGA